MLTIDADNVIDKFGIEYFRELSTFGALPDEMILELLRGGTIVRLAKGEYIARFDEEASDFQVVLSGKLAFYKRYEGHDVLTRYFRRGEQVGFRPDDRAVCTATAPTWPWKTVFYSASAASSLRFARGLSR